MNRADFDYLCRFAEEAQAKLSSKEQAFVALHTFGGLSPTAAAKRLGYKAPGASARQILQRDHVADVLAAMCELAREYVRLSEAAEK
jgi:DNA-directed RNA polymerase specialized sigma24 family protein